MRYITNTDPETIKKESEAKRRKRPSTGEACLHNGNLDSDFPQILNQQDSEPLINIDKKPEGIQEIFNNTIIKWWITEYI